jgi:outer membrane protein assembly factor BamA
VRILCIIVILFSCINSIEAKFNIAAYPQFSYAEDTGFLAGVISYSRFQFKDYPEDIPKQKLTIQAVYTSKKQFSLRFEPFLFTKNGLYEFETEFEYKYFPTEFYEVGNTNFNAESEKYTSKRYSIDLIMKRKINESWFLLGLAEMYRSKLAKTEADGILVEQSTPGSEPFSLIGLGAGLMYDTRNSATYPTNGDLVKFEFNGYNNLFGSDYNYVQLRFVASKYFSFIDNHVLAISSNMIFTDNIAPFQKLPQLGDQLRAYPDEIFTNEKIYVFRAEYRVFPFSSKVLDRLGFVLFIDSGEVVSEVEDFSISSIRCSYGGGFRFSIFTDERFNLRFDIGFCKDHQNFEISGGEAF